MSQRVSTKTKESPRADKSVEQCVHHWIIDPPDEPVSKGICKICGAEKNFDNVVPSDVEWK